MNKINPLSIAVVTLLVAALLITLKLTDVITWSWFWILSPWWISAALLLLVIVCFVGWMYFFDIEED